MLPENGQVKVADFGIARLVSSDLSQAGFVIGTPGYMSPEGRVGDLVDSRSDLYSFGVVFYEMHAGKRIEFIALDNATLNRTSATKQPSPDFIGQKKSASSL